MGETMGDLKIHHPLLTPEEVELLEKVAGSADPDVAQLRDALWRLAKLKVSEGDFPKYAAMIDEERCNGYACLLVEKMPVGHGRLVWDGAKTPIENCTLMTKKLECGTSDLFLCARPCIRIAESVALETRQRLADLGNLCVTVENLPLRSLESSQMFMEPAERDGVAHHIWRGPLVDFLADENGYGVHRQPSVLRAPRVPITGLFPSGTLDEEIHAHPADLGVFLAGGTVISVDLHYPILATETVVLDVGLVMARYEAKAMEG
jgi:hypothetical protein